MRPSVAGLFALLALVSPALSMPMEARSITASGDGTWFNPGLGACGVVNTDNDFIVAVSHSFYDSFPGATANPNQNPVCGKKMTVNYQGREVDVTVVDRCVGCAVDDVDMSPAAFSQLAGLDVGRIKVTWTLH